MSWRNVFLAGVLGGVLLAGMPTSMPVVGLPVAEATVLRTDEGWGVEIDDSSVYEITHGHARAQVRTHGMRPIWTDWYAVDVKWWKSNFSVRSLDPNYSIGERDSMALAIVNYMVDKYGLAY